MCRYTAVSRWGFELLLWFLCFASYTNLGFDEYSFGTAARGATCFFLPGSVYQYVGALGVSTIYRNVAPVGRVHSLKLVLIQVPQTNLGCDHYSFV